MDDEHVSRPGVVVLLRKIALAAALFVGLFVARVTVYDIMDPLGDHNEGTALDMALLSLLVRRMERPSSRARARGRP